MRRLILWTVILVCFGVAVFPVRGTADGDLKILTYPIGLVTGAHPIETDLGAEGKPAELYLDGVSVCSLRASKSQCTVDLGDAPHVHLLELIRRDAAGRVAARASRWINRPGQEAELAIQLEGRNPQGICGGMALWSHPLKKDPVLLEVTQDGLILRIRDDGRSFRFPCPDANQPHVIAASAIFPDGRRAEAVAVSGGFGGHTETGLTAVALESSAPGTDPCAAVSAQFPEEVKRVADSGFEVVFVLDPTAGYRTLMASGWSKGMMPTTTNSTKQFDSLVQQGSKGSDARPKSSWKKAESAFIDADRLWFVLPDENLQRANGFGQGRMNWLPMLFNFGSVNLPDQPRLADAVAASGLVAAAGPRQRAVVLILGNKADRDRSGFTADQARSYLAEVGVPLYVFRNGKLREDGWPQGVPVRNMEAMAGALEAIKADLGAQCVAWFPGRMHPNQIAEALPDGVEIAGRRGEAPGEVEVVWRQAAADKIVLTDQAEVADARLAGDTRVEVTAVTVLFAARDDDGSPIADLGVNEIAVVEDGRSVTVLGLARMPIARTEAADPEPAAGAPSEPEPSAAGEAMPVAVYVDRRLSGSMEISNALRALGDRADWLASLGPVDVVVSEDEVTTVIEGATDPQAIRSALEELAIQPTGQHAIELIRTRFLRDIRKIPNRLTRGDIVGGGGDTDAGDPARAEGLDAGQEERRFERYTVLTAARSAIFEEDGVLRLTATRVSDWALTTPIQRPRLLFVVGVGFDEDPVDFYLPFIERLETHSAGDASEEFKRFRQSARVEGVGRDLAAAGWLVVPVATSTAGSQTGAAEIGDGDRFQTFMSAQPDAIRSSYAQFLMLDPLGSQRHLAAPSGGEVAIGGAGLDRLIEESAGWYRLTYQIDRPPDGVNHELAISTNRVGANIRSTSVIASETLEGEAAARVRRLLRGSQDTGGLTVEIVLTEPQSTADNTMSAEATVTMRLEAISALLVEGGRRPLRVSVGVLARDNEPFVLHRAETMDGVVAAWGYRVPLRWQEGPATIAVVVEDLGSGAWGGAVGDIR
jgi:hypothetical protein